MNVDGIPSDETIIHRCADPRPESVISGAPWQNRIIRITESLVVKYGLHVTEEEASNQRHAFRLLDPRIVRVPRVHRFFRDDRGRGYLVMDFAAGEVLETLAEIHYERVAAMLAHFRQLSSPTPGNLGGQGVSYRCPFPDEGLAVSHVAAMEEWFNSRLFAHQRRDGDVSFANSDLVFCHRDLAPRNMLWQEDGSVCLLD